jgi:methylated-DNA-protein-cysteine methyltransferase related protein
VDEELVRRVRAIVAAIPPGEVRCYADVAAEAGLPSPRLVGRMLGGGVPWHRVLRADGTPAPHLARRQIALLQDEGVLFVNGRIAKPPTDLRRRSRGRRVASS